MDMKLPRSYAQKQPQYQVCRHAREDIVENYANAAADLLIGETNGPRFEPVESAEEAEGKSESEYAVRQPGDGHPVADGLVHNDTLVVLDAGIGAELMGGQRRHDKSGKKETCIGSMARRQQRDEGEADQRAYSAAAGAAVTPGEPRGHIPEKGTSGDKRGYSRRNCPAHSLNFNRIGSASIA